MKKRSTILAWILCAFAVFGVMAGLINDLKSAQASNLSSTFINDLTFSPFLIISAVVGALIISRHPRNIIGWLLMFFPLTLGILNNLQPLLNSSASPEKITLSVFLIHWLKSWSWWLLIGPILLIPLLFPTGRLLSRRWRWAVVSLAVCFLTFLVIAAVPPTIEVNTTQVRNPLGIVTPGIFNLLLIVFQAFLIITAISCVLAIFVRYRRAPADEREQIKWLVYAFAVFLVVYLVGGIFQSDNPQFGILFNIVLIGIPLAIGAAILRYHLWDIDLIINRTLVYIPLTAILAGLYSVTVALTQKFIVSTTGEKSDVAVIMTTFLLVATFTPIKNVLQQAVDKRFKESSSTLKEIRAFENQVNSVMEVLDSNLITRRLLSVSVSALHASGGAIYVEHGGDLRLIHATDDWGKIDRRVSIPLTWNGSQIGILCLGPRKHGGDYTLDERQAIQQAADRVASAVRNFALVDEG